jgi:hypothetical protein
MSYLGSTIYTDCAINHLTRDPYDQRVDYGFLEEKLEQAKTYEERKKIWLNYLANLKYYERND